MRTDITLKKRSKTYKIAHLYPTKRYMDYILLPYGILYNENLTTAQKGDKIKFLDKITVSITNVTLLDIQNPLADLLCRSRYGIPIRRALQIWREIALLSGCGVKAISDKKCLIIFYNDNS